MPAVRGGSWCPRSRSGREEGFGFVARVVRERDGSCSWRLAENVREERESIGPEETEESDCKNYVSNLHDPRTKIAKEGYFKRNIAISLLLKMSGKMQVRYLLNRPESPACQLDP